jgi:hypothetical protein
VGDQTDRGGVAFLQSWPGLRRAEAASAAQAAQGRA